MGAFTSSYGFGFGAFGSIGPFGHGPWPSFPAIRPGYVHAEQMAYAVAVNQFEDLTEQRYLLSREQGLRLVYEFSYVSSALATELSSWFVAAGGPACRFWARDYNTDRAYVVRFAEQTYGHTLGPGLIRQVPTILFDVVGSWTTDALGGYGYGAGGYGGGGYGEGGY